MKFYLFLLKPLGVNISMNEFANLVPAYASLNIQMFIFQMYNDLAHCIIKTYNKCSVCNCRESEDTVLMILKETYALKGISPIKPGSDTSKKTGPPPIGPGAYPMSGGPPQGPPISGVSGPPPMSQAQGFTPSTNFDSSFNMGGPPLDSSFTPQAASGPVGPPPMAGFMRKQ
ncbi:unnamed protein product [Owenia fusiformis]|uniref:Uncharacterized protein n=1 Tax=Owenia fusiformis TaxID=6347 RepID=A0A8S4NS34_OWEFU|nr:unnamed protein product [Owenia fusiformis]